MINKIVLEKDSRRQKLGKFWEKQSIQTSEFLEVRTAPRSLTLDPKFVGSIELVQLFESTYFYKNYILSKIVRYGF